MSASGKFYRNKVDPKEMVAIDELRRNAESSRQFVSNRLQGSDLLKNIYGHNLRVKDSESICRKLVETRLEIQRDKVRKGKNESYDLSDMKDILGLRLITNFSSDVPSLVTAVIEHFQNPHALKPSPFEMRSVSNLTIYPLSTSGMKAEVAKAIQGAAKLMLKDSCEPEIIAHKKLYSGVHICGLSLTESGTKVPFEIQVRSIFEHVYAEIAHKIYELNRVREQEHGAETPRISEHMIALKNILDAASGYTDIIAKEVHEFISTQVPKKSPIKVNLSTPHEIETTCRERNVDEGAILRFLPILEEKRDLEHALRDPASERSDGEYIQIARQLRTLFEEEQKNGALVNFEQWDESQKTLFYFLRMEEAACRLFSNTKEQYLKARDIYLSLKADYPNAITLHFRLGQTYGQLDHLSACIEAYKMCNSLIKSKPKSPSFDFTEMEEDYVSENINRLLSFTYWRKGYNQFKSQDEEGRAQAFENIFKGYITAKEGLKVVLEGEPRERLLNCTLYFGTELLDKFKLMLGDREGEVADDLQKMVTELNSHIQMDNPNHMNRMDSMSYALFILGQKDEAITYAKQVIELWRKNETLSAVPSIDMGYPATYDLEKYEIILRRALDTCASA